MALFTLNNAGNTSNILKYEQLDSDETVTSASSLPTAAASQNAATADQRTLEGTATATPSVAPIRATLGSGANDSGAANTTGTAQSLSGDFGQGAANQSFTGVNSALGNPSGLATSTPDANSYTVSHGDIATSSSSSSSLSQNNIFTPNPGTPGNPNNPGNPGNPPGNPGNPGNPDTPTHTPAGPIIAADINTGLLPNIHLDITPIENLPQFVTEQVVAPVTTLVTSTLTDVLTGNPNAVPNLVTNTLDTVQSVLNNTGINLGLGDLNIIGTNNTTPSVPLIYLGEGDTGSEPVASLIDVRVLQNLSSLSELSPEDFTPQNLGNTLNNVIGGTVNDLLGGLLNPNGPQLEVTLGNDGSPTSEGLLGDIGLLNGIPGLGTSPLLELTMGADTPTAEGSLIDIQLTPSDGTIANISLPLMSSAPIIDLTLGADNSATQGSLASVGLLNSPDALVSLTIPGLSETPLIELGTNTIPQLTEVLAPVTDINLLEGGSLASITVPLLGDATLVDIGLGNNATTQASVLDVDISNLLSPTATPVVEISVLPNLESPVAHITLGSESPTAATSLLGTNLLGGGSDSTQLINLNIGNSTGGAEGSLLNVSLLSHTDMPTDNLLHTALDTITGTDATQGAVTAVTSLVTSATTPVTDIVSHITDTLTAPPTADPVASVTSLLDAVAQIPAHVSSGMESTINTVSSTVSAAASTVTSSVTDTINHTTSNVADTLNQATSTATSTAAAVTSAVTSVVTAPVTTITNPIAAITKITTPILHGLHW